MGEFRNLGGSRTDKITDLCVSALATQANQSQNSLIGAPS